MSTSHHTTPAADGPPPPAGTTDVGAWQRHTSPAHRAVVGVDRQLAGRVNVWVEAAQLPGGTLAYDDAPPRVYIDVGAPGGAGLDPEEVPALIAALQAAAEQASAWRRHCVDPPG